MNIPEKGRFDSTISTSKEESLTKAMEIMMDDIKNNQKVQVLIRPKVSLIKGIIPIIFYIGSYIFILIQSEQISYFLSINKVLFLIGVTLVYIVIFAIFLKRLLIWMILIYQKYAPEKVRKLCCYEPSCSEYMKVSIQKHGVLRGVYKGLNRLSRCHWPNGGVDNP